MSYYLPAPRAPGAPEPRHNAVGAWFLGPRAENFNYLQKFFGGILAGQKDARRELYPHDQDFITPEMQASELFQQNIVQLDQELTAISDMLSQHSIPFWSPRYNGHMNMDTSMPAVIGYLTTMLYNPNNVATEASPFTTVVETVVGRQLSKMLGFNTNPDNKNKPLAWGHITCDGSVANLESMWVARNLKFYPLSLRLATLEGQLKFLIDPGMQQRNPFEVTLCTGVKRLFKTCTTWELLNLTPGTIFDIPNQLYQQYGISQTFLQNALHPYLAQTLGGDYLEKKFRLVNPAKFFVVTTKHYSWPKGGAITGIGSENIIDVSIDNAARMDPAQLDSMLAQCIASKDENMRTPVYAVVAIMGSTDQGAVDPLGEILDLRTKYQSKGLSFVVHCDAAWGGYFASMLRERPTEGLKSPDFVPSLSLQKYTKAQLERYPEADSITIDPHKSGYCPYPAGGLCYRDGRMRYLVTWTSPVVVHSKEDENESIGVYGVEGSKPGAPAVGAFLSHEVIGLDYRGYGALLGEATFTCTKLYSHWATMTRDNDPKLVVVPFNMLPAEKEPHPTPEKIELQKEFIRKRIVNRNNTDLYHDKEAMALLEQLGSDLMINAFACNFKIDGKINEDVVEANYLNNRIFSRLSVMTVEDVVGERPLFLTSSVFEQSAYKGCLDNFKRRLGLKGEQDLFVLVNVTMSPWPTANNFLKQLVDQFDVIARQEIEACILRNKVTPDKHGFIMQGTDSLHLVHLVHLPMFNMANHRYQAIVTGDLPPDVMQKYTDAKTKNPGQFFVLGSTEDSILPDLLKEGGSFKAIIFQGLPDDDKPLCKDFVISNIHVVFDEPLSSNALNPGYPAQMPFYLYGTPAQPHVDHVLRKSPSIQLNSDRVTLDLAKCLTDEQLAAGLVAISTDVLENSMQPINKDHTKFESRCFSFVPGAKFAVSIFMDYKASQTPGAIPLTEGTITLGTSVYADDTDINMDPGMHVKEGTPLLIGGPRGAAPPPGAN